MSGGRLSGDFLDGARGRILVVRRDPVAAPRGCVLVVPPFGEEMNKSRRMIAESMRALADAGWASAIPDLHGTGDSDGEFRDATPEVWLDDLTATADWLRRAGRPVRAILGIRLGCLLGAQLAARLPEACERSVFWQPVISGKQMFTQFLRLRVAASAMSEGPKETASGLQQRLEAGEILEVAGYELTGAMARGIAALDLAGCLTPRLGALRWIEVVPAAGEAPGPASQQGIERCRAAGLHVDVQAVPGDPFWNATEIVSHPAIVEATAAWMHRDAAAAA